VGLYSGGEKNSGYLAHHTLDGRGRYASDILHDAIHILVKLNEPPHPLLPQLCPGLAVRSSLFSFYVGWGGLGLNAEGLCDRLGIFVDGALRCIGSPKELTARFGGFFILTITRLDHSVVDISTMLSFERHDAFNIWRRYTEFACRSAEHRQNIASGKGQTMNLFG
jgi:hypothetical protein